MIYLVEDKSSRRKDYGWDDHKLEENKDIVVIIKTPEELFSCEDKILNEKNVLLYHESFGNSSDYQTRHELDSFIKKAEEKQLYIAFFSGSKSFRTLDDNICNLPPQYLYSNLQEFVIKYRQGINDFRYLMFGSHPDMEEKLHDSLSQVMANNFSFSRKSIHGDFFFASSSDTELSLYPPIENSTFNDELDFDCTDQGLCEYIQKNFNNICYNVIYIPLCFGDTLSDLLGLRLAMLIRFSNTMNKFAQIRIYGEADYPTLLGNECADILKMPGVHYISAASQSILEGANNLSPITENDYKKGLQNIHLNIPSDIGDNHSIANQWAIYRWSNVLEDSDDDIEKVRERIDTTLYFKYMTSLYPVKEIKRLSKESLKIDKDNQQDPLKVLYVDDEADLGWYELLSTLLYDNNQLEYDYIGDNLKMKSEEEIINITMDKVKEMCPNVVILDFRLHPSDFHCSQIKKITGYRLLNQIKEYNRGIQVVIFSATNKIWNLQLLEHAEADGFIIKESPLNSVDPSFTASTISYLVKQLSQCAHNTYKAKIWAKIQILKDNLRTMRRSHKINKDYANAIITLLSMTEDTIFTKGMKYPFASAFMHLFRIVEATANEWIENKSFKDDENIENRYFFKFRSDDSKLLEFPVYGNSTSPKGVLYTPNKTLPYFQKICNTLYSVGANSEDIYYVVQKRNEFTHPNLTQETSLASFEAKDFIMMFNIVFLLIGKINVH